jgi:hypothetical protein
MKTTRAIQRITAPATAFNAGAVRAQPHPMQRQIDTSSRQQAQSVRIAQLQGSGRAVVQRVSDEEVRDAANACDHEETKAAIPAYSKGWKSKNNATRKKIYEDVHANEGTWYAVRDHVMLGEGTTPPKGYHSKALGAASESEAVGNKNPATVGAKRPYKQWTKKRNQAGNDHLKISTFFPDNWNEAKIRANVLLSYAGVDHRMTDQLDMDHPGDETFYPTTALGNPLKPA